MIPARQPQDTGGFRTTANKLTRYTAEDCKDPGLPTPAPQPHPDDLFLITREELDRCCSQMSAAGYKVSANYIEALVLSRPHISAPASSALAELEALKAWACKNRQQVTKWNDGCPFVWWYQLRDEIDRRIATLRQQEPQQ